MNTRTEPIPPLPELEDPRPHLEAGHDVRIWYPDWHVGYLAWNSDGEYADIADSKGQEAGDTESAWCNDCDVELELTDVIP